MTERTRSAGRRLTAITIDQAISSASNVLISILAARALGIASFGLFGIVFVIYVTAQGLSRAMVGEPLLVRPAEAEERPGEAIGTGILVGIAIGSAVVLTGLVASIWSSELSGGLIALGLCLPFLILQDLGRYLAFALHRPARALVLDLVWLGLVMVAVAGLFVADAQTLSSFIAAWAGSGALAGLVLFWQYRGHRVRFTFAWLRETWAFSWRYVLSFASLQSAALGFSVALLALAGARALGSVRGALLLLGPFVQFQAASIAAGVAEVSRMTVRSPELVRHVRKSTLLTSCVALVNGAILLSLPDRVGELVLGATWKATEALLLPASVQMLLLGLISGVRSGLLGLRAVRTTVRIDIATTFITLTAGVVGAIVDGSRGVFWFLAAAQGIVGAIWWIVYLNHVRTGEPGHSTGASNTSGLTSSAPAGP